MTEVCGCWTQPQYLVWWFDSDVWEYRAFSTNFDVAWDVYRYLVDKDIPALFDVGGQVVMKSAAADAMVEESRRLFSDDEAGA